MNETAKASRRRRIETATGYFDWDRIFRGKGIDVGCGPDKLPYSKVEGFDLAQGDANRLVDFVKPESYSYLHASQCLEHMHDPVIALKHWIAAVRKGGYLVVTIPDFVLYEQLLWPSRFNGDHKSTWSMWLPKSPANIHCYLPEWLKQFQCKIVTCRVVDTNYDYTLLHRTKLVDQTYVEADGVEAFIEFVLKK